MTPADETPIAPAVHAFATTHWSVVTASDVDYQNMVTALDILQQVDFTKVGLATESVP